MPSHVTSNSHHNPSSPNYPAHPPQAHQPQFDDDDDVKAPYDDLIDQYATPYRSNSPHKTFNLTDGRTGVPTYPLTHKHTNNSDDSGKDIEGSTSEGTDWGYPPGPPQVDKEKKSWWSSVRTFSFPSISCGAHTSYFLLLLQLVTDSIACRLYLLTVLLETTVDLAIEADLFIRFRDVQTQQPDVASQNKMPVYLALFALAQCVQCPSIEWRKSFSSLFIACFNLGWLLTPSMLEIHCSSSSSREWLGLQLWT